VTRPPILVTRARHGPTCLSLNPHDWNALALTSHNCNALLQLRLTAHNCVWLGSAREPTGKNDLQCWAGDNPPTHGHGEAEAARARNHSLMTRPGSRDQP
jgi:hypothetical protein